MQIMVDPGILVPRKDFGWYKLFGQDYHSTKTGTDAISGPSCYTTPHFKQT